MVNESSEPIRLGNRNKKKNCVQCGDAVGFDDAKGIFWIFFSPLCDARIPTVQPQSPNECLNISICLIENRFVEWRHPKNTKHAILFLFFFQSLHSHFIIKLKRSWTGSWTRYNCWMSNAKSLTDLTKRICHLMSARNAEKSIENRMDNELNESSATSLTVVASFGFNAFAMNM